MQLENVKTKFLGKNNIFYNHIDSTQNEIWRLIESKILQMEPWYLQIFKIKE